MHYYETAKTVEAIFGIVSGEGISSRTEKRGSFTIDGQARVSKLQIPKNHKAVFEVIFRNFIYISDF
jgi:hypothetical protein